VALGFAELDLDQYERHQTYRCGSWSIYQTFMYPQLLDTETSIMIILRFFLVHIIAVIATSGNQAVAEDLVHVRLMDRLDRPADGYCLDIPGAGANLLLDVPLFAHNCKNGPTPDSALTFTGDGQLIFPAAAVCVTAFGINNTVLPGTSILLRPCNFRTAFFDTENLQKFNHLKNGQLQLRGYDLCLAVGEQSSRTYSPSDRWRVLTMQFCREIELMYSSWEMVNL